VIDIARLRDLGGQTDFLVAVDQLVEVIDGVLDPDQWATQR
jgi:hypothetical protein